MSNSLCVREAVSGRRRAARRLNAFAGCAQREKILSLNSLCVREAVSGRRRAARRLNAFAGLRAARKKIKLKFVLCSRGCFGKEARG